MNRCEFMHYNCRKSRSGLTLVELMTTTAIASILAFGIGALVIGGQRSWQRIYDSAHTDVKSDALVIMTTFGNMGRKANRIGYIIYDISGSTFVPAVPQTSNPEEVVSGDAVEFRYWDVELDMGDSYGLLDFTKTGTAYALFYVDGEQLKVDYGSYPPGAVPDGGGNRNTTGITTKVLTDNISVDPNDVFSHTTLNGVGQGSVRINVTLGDSGTGESTKVMTATLLRNIWPR